MTTPDLGPAAERAADELARRLRGIVPASLLADPDGFARRYWSDAIAEGWRYRPPLPTTPTGTSTGGGVPAAAHAGELEEARRRCAEATRALREAEGRAEARAALEGKDPDAH